MAEKDPPNEVFLGVYKCYTVYMKMTATEARKNLSALLRTVERGTRVEITSYGRVVAVMNPPEEHDDLDPEVSPHTAHGGDSTDHDPEPAP